MMPDDEQCNADVDGQEAYDEEPQEEGKEALLEVFEQPMISLYALVEVTKKFQAM